MDDKIIAIFCLCDDLLKAMHHQEDRQCQMNDAEIMTTAFIAALFFRGNHESARAMLKQHGYIIHMVRKSRFSRRLHRIKDVFIIFFNLLAQTWKILNTDAVYRLTASLLLCATICVFGAQRYTPRKIFGAIKRARNGTFMDSRFI